MIGEISNQFYQFVSRRISTLIERSSVPNKKEWIQLPGSEKGHFNSRKEADEYLKSLIGSNPTDSES